MTELKTVSLVPFQPAAGEQFSCTAGMKTEGGLLHLEYAVNGPISDISIPLEAALPGFTLGLWQHTCFECFVRPAGTESYTEWNFSLDCNWWHCDFDGYRQPARNQPPGLQPQNFQIIHRQNSLILMAAIACPAAPGLRAGPAIILEHLNGGRSHWAAAHPGAKPDFHSPGTCLPLP